MKPIEEFTEQDGILIETEQESQEIRELLHGMGLKWQNGDSYLELTILDIYPILLLPKKGYYFIGNDFKQVQDYNVHPASDYLIKPGDEVEVRDTESMAWATGLKYIGKTSKEILVVEDKNGNVSVWHYIRKAPNPKAKAIAEIKKIAEENGIEVKIL
jgi:ABC-type uncharacterized transport system permease subunit